MLPAIEIITLLLLLPYTVLLFYYRHSWLQMKEFFPPENPVYTTFISVIVPARNEEKNIRACIHSIMQQTYPSDLFELIIVDDHSTDATADIVLSFPQKNIYLLQLSDVLPNDIINSYKKKAIESAIKISKGSVIVTTDADCIVKPQWLEQIAALYESSGPVFMAAPVCYFDFEKNDSSLKKFFKIFQSLDFLSLQGITGASVSRQFHNMCNGANLGYEKKAFEAVNGFEGIDNIASGDDMLLLYKIAKKFPGKISYLKSGSAIVYTKSAESLSAFFHQRIRWASKASLYPDAKITTVLFFVYFANVWLLALSVLSFFSIKYFYLLLAAMVLKIAGELIFLFPVAGFFDKKKLLWWFIPSQPFHILYTVIAGLLGKFGHYTWKGRKVK
ncbi:MAG TPA: glycosyltransferase [Chitinophagaceae bacterium]|nr:glycosyltransferase [Chitinophagaceae bacterium]